jgi:hypothetical protein
LEQEDLQKELEARFGRISSYIITNHSDYINGLFLLKEMAMNAKPSVQQFIDCMIESERQETNKEQAKTSTFTLEFEQFYSEVVNKIQKIQFQTTDEAIQEKHALLTAISVLVKFSISKMISDHSTEKEISEAQRIQEDWLSALADKFGDKNLGNTINDPGYKHGLSLLKKMVRNAKPSVKQFIDSEYNVLRAVSYQQY